MNVTKAERAFITVAGSEIEVFMLPDGSYRYSQVSAARAIGLDKSDPNKYFKNTNPSAADGALTVQVKSARVKGLTEEAVSQYWQWKASNGNKEALALVTALTAEALTRRADTAFGQTKTEQQYEYGTSDLRLSLLRKILSEYQPYGEDIYDINHFEAPPELTPVEAYLAEDLAYLKKWVQLQDLQPQCAEGYRQIIEHRSKMIEDAYEINPDTVLA